MKSFITHSLCILLAVISVAFLYSIPGSSPEINAKINADGSKTTIFLPETEIPVILHISDANGFYKEIPINEYAQIELIHSPNNAFCSLHTKEYDTGFQQFDLSPKVNNKWQHVRFINHNDGKITKLYEYTYSSFKNMPFAYVSLFRRDPN